MDDLKGTLDFLSWAPQATAAVRSALADLNVPLPAVLAQLLGLLVFGLLVWMFSRRALGAETNLRRLLAWIGCVASGVGAVAILAAWADNAVVPRSSELVGRVEAAGRPGFHVTLLDYRGESLGAEVETDATGSFLVRYSPEFADPPSGLLVTAPGCAETRFTLRRAHLLGAAMTISFQCGTQDG